MAYAHKGEGVDFTAYCAADVVPGYLVKAMSVEDPSATSDPFTAVMVDKVDAAGDIPLVVGVATGSVTSGNMVSVKTKGTELMMAGGAIPAGNIVGATGADPSAVKVVTAGSEIGKALTVAASGEQVLINLDV